LILLNQILQGVLLGGYYALIACGLSFMFGVMGVINLAHGSLAVLSAYALYVLADRFGVEPFLGLCVVAPLMALVGWALQRLVLERSARGGLLVPVLSTFGLSIILDNLLFEGFGADTRLHLISAISPTTAGRSPTRSRSASSRRSPWGLRSRCSAALRPISTEH